VQLWHVFVQEQEERARRRAKATTHAKGTSGTPQLQATNAQHRRPRMKEQSGGALLLLERSNSLAEEFATPTKPPLSKPISGGSDHGLPGQMLQGRGALQENGPGTGGGS